MRAYTLTMKACLFYLVAAQRRGLGGHGPIKEHVLLRSVAVFQAFVPRPFPRVPPLLGPPRGVVAGRDLKAGGKVGLVNARWRLLAVTRHRLQKVNFWSAPVEVRGRARKYGGGGGGVWWGVSSASEDFT